MKDQKLIFFIYDNNGTLNPILQEGNEMDVSEVFKLIKRVKSYPGSYFGFKPSANCKVLFKFLKNGRLLLDIPNYLQGVTIQKEIGWEECMHLINAIYSKPNRDFSKYPGIFTSTITENSFS